jgi:hypothetical protein
MKRMPPAVAICGVLSLVVPVSTTVADDIQPQIEAILKVEKEAAGHSTAVAAMKWLEEQPTLALLPLLQAMDHANPIAANWLRGAFEAAADRNAKRGNSLPIVELEKFLLDRAHAAQPRQAAFDLLVRTDPKVEDRLVPGMIDDPCPEFRRMAVQRLIDAAAKASEAKDVAKSKALYQQAFAAARDPDQLGLTFDELTKLGERPDLKRQLGLLTDWWVIGPFDHRKGIGFDIAYPPEKETDFTKKYNGMLGEVAWGRLESDDRHGIVDLNKLLARHKGAIVYAYREFESEKAQPAEIRLGTPNGWKLWVNGKLAFAHEEYHLLTQMDQYPTRIMLQPGMNRFLLKICQNEQTEDWAQEWQFQVRVCDPTGAAVLQKSTKAAPGSDGVQPAK